MVEVGLNLGQNFELMLLALVVLMAVLIVSRMGVVVINQFERGIVEMWGAYQKMIDPGLHFIIPVAQNVMRINMREQVIDVPPQEIIT